MHVPALHSKEGEIVMEGEELVAYIEGYIDALIKTMEGDEENKQTIYWLDQLLVVIEERRMD